MAVRTYERLSGDSEPLDVYLMADSVTGFGDVNAVFERDGLYVSVVVRVLEAGLDRVVVDIRDRTVGLYLVHAEGLELQIRHRSGRVLRKRLVDADRYFLARDHLALGKVRRYNFSGYIHCCLLGVMCSLIFFIFYSFLRVLSIFRGLVAPIFRFLRPFACPQSIFAV